MAAGGCAATALALALALPFSLPLPLPLPLPVRPAASAFAFAFAFGGVQIRRFAFAPNLLEGGVGERLRFGGRSSSSEVEGGGDSEGEATSCASSSELVGEPGDGSRGSSVEHNLAVVRYKAHQAVTRYKGYLKKFKR